MFSITTEVKQDQGASAPDILGSVKGLACIIPLLTRGFPFVEHCGAKREQGE